MAIWAWPVTVLGNTLRGVLFQFVPTWGRFVPFVPNVPKSKLVFFFKIRG